MGQPRMESVLSAKWSGGFVLLLEHRLKRRVTQLYHNLYHRPPALVSAHERQSVPGVCTLLCMFTARKRLKNAIVPGSSSVACLMATSVGFVTISDDLLTHDLRALSTRTTGGPENSTTGRP